MDDIFGAKSHNLGSGLGYSVLEVVKVTKKVTGKDIPCKIAPRRQADPPALVLSCVALGYLGYQLSSLFGRR